ncbi:MAG: basic amino acid/polyamine antiporter, family [Solirubrobacteraceae bacterium]|jgi:APA family basic amino acid/polyamine antiporter|nr:basic amino acid/polyamine antiporter, family [Solirubrobacteraceae bacterium]
MATATRPGPFARKPTEHLARETSGDDGLKRAVGVLDLTALGIGAIIGTGIFVIIGEAISDSGPSIVISFALAGVTCLFSALSYGELASSIPVSGSAYTYGYATMGELVGWIIGWDLILEYGVSVAAVAVGWGGYVQSLLQSLFGINLPDSISAPPGDGGTVNLPSVLLVLAVTALLVYGVRESARTNTVMVFVKIVILIFFIVVGVFHIHGGNFSPWAPKGFNGTADAAALIFFAYIGFDAVSTSGEEAENAQRDLPIAIIGSLLIATLLYILVSIVAVGLAPASKLAGSDAPLSDAIKIGAGLNWAGDLLSFGALVAITSVTLTILYGQTRIFFAMSRDGLLPPIFARLTSRRTPAFTTITFGILTAIMAALLPLTEIAKLVNIGTLFAFLIVNIGVIILRRTQPDLERGFRVPLVPWFPLIGAALCIYLMTKLELVTWYRFFGWLALGLVIYFLYGRTHSRLQRGEGPDRARADLAV